MPDMSEDDVKRILTNPFYCLSRILDQGRGD